MRKRIQIQVLITLIVIISNLFAAPLYGQQSSTAIKDNRSIRMLNTLFPVDDIISITVSNKNRIHKLSTRELNEVKKLLKQATSVGGDLLPGYCTLDIKLKDNAIAQPGVVYANWDAIHFNGATDISGNVFRGSFYLPGLDFNDYVKVKKKRNATEKKSRKSAGLVAAPQD